MRLEKLFILTIVALLLATICFAQTAKVDSLSMELQKRIARLTELEKLSQSDSVVSLRSGELEEIINEVEKAVAELDVVFDGSKLLINGSDGNLSISISEDLDEALSERISSITEQILFGLPDSSEVHQGLSEIRSGLEHFGVLDNQTEYDIIDELVVVGEDASVAINQRVIGDVAVVFGDLFVDGIVEGDVVVVNGSVELTDNSIVLGDVVGVLSSVKRDEETRIDGQVIVIGRDVLPKGVAGLFTFNFARLVWSIILNILFIGLVILIFQIFPQKRLDLMADYLKNSALRSTWLGVLWIVVGNLLFWILVVLLAMTVVGIPLSVFLVLAYLIAMMLSVGTVARWLGFAFLEKRGSENISMIKSLLIGCVIICLPNLLAESLAPLSGVASFIFNSISFTVLVSVYCIGSGALIGSKVGSAGE